MNSYIHPDKFMTEENDDNESCNNENVNEEKQFENENLKFSINKN